MEWLNEQCSGCSTRQEEVVVVVVEVEVERWM